MELKPMLLEKLEIVKAFQEKHPTAHLGGSIGLLIRGIDLKRNLEFSDLDITVDEHSEDLKMDNFELRSENNDFDYAFKQWSKDGAHYHKVDVRVCPEPSYDVLEFNGSSYNVSKLRDILFWKKKYADKGVNKHRNDLITIETGVRPPEPIQTIGDDELPF